MATRRLSVNPARVKANVAALDEGPAPAGPSRGRRALARAAAPLLCLLSGALLLASFAPADLWPLAYVALVPLVVASVREAPGRRAMPWVYAGGVAFWLAGVYWLSWITPIGYAALVLYMGVYWLAAGWLLRRAHRRGWPAWAALPVVWVALEYARAHVMSGFPWFFLAHSQYARTLLIQIADVTGQYGVSFLVAMVNGAAADALLLAGRAKGDRRRRLVRVVLPGVAACALLAAAFQGYGAYRMGELEHVRRPGPKVGLVQEAIPISLWHSDEGQDVFKSYLAMSEGLKGKGCNLVVWPESMLGYFNLEPAVWYARRADEVDPATGRPMWTPAQQEIISRHRAVLSDLRGLLAGLGCPLLAGGPMPGRLPRSREARIHSNSALLYDLAPDGHVRLAGRYDKMHLVPFGEYVPFEDGWPALHRLLRRFVPEVMPQLEAGSHPVVFDVPAGGRKFSFVAPICYEGCLARVCRRMVMRDGRKAADLLVNISNDGWFIFGRGLRAHASTELEQHLAQYVFRAVETRVGVLRAVNTGISAYIDSAGRIDPDAGPAERRARRKMVARSLVKQTLVDDRVTVYSRWGDWFALTTSMAAGVGTVVVLTPRPAGKKKDEKA